MSGMVYGRRNRRQPSHVGLISQVGVKDAEGKIGEYGGAGLVRDFICQTGTLNFILEEVSKPKINNQIKK